MADPPPAVLWILPTIGFGLFFIAMASGDEGIGGIPAEPLMLSLFAAVCATPLIAAFVDGRAIVPVWLAGSMPLVAVPVIAVWTHSGEEFGGLIIVPVAGFVAAYTCYVAALFLFRSVVRYLFRPR
jgi:hypothetical protein